MPSVEHRNEWDVNRIALDTTDIHTYMDASAYAPSGASPNIQEGMNAVGIGGDEGKK